MSIFEVFNSFKFFCFFVNKNFFHSLLLLFLMFFIPFILGIIIFKKLIPILRDLKYGQIERTEGMLTHQNKQGTPTMGGIVFIILIYIFLFILSILNFKYKLFFSNIIPYFVLIFTIILFGIIGIFDDYLKISKKNTKGLSSIKKLICQIIISLIFYFAMSKLYVINSDFNILSNYLSPMVIFLLDIFIIVGTNNGVNFTDGIDGLCTVVTIIISIFYTFISMLQLDIFATFINIYVIGILFSFLIYNHYPAKIFMGDTGSLFLGGFVALMAIYLKIQYLLPIYGFIYMIEVLSVIIQVSYFKLTHGKRIFKMAPIHHHFEKCGFSEKQVVMMFSAITLILCIISFMIFIYCF